MSRGRKGNSPMKRLAYLAFTERGYELACKLADVSGGIVSGCGTYWKGGSEAETVSLQEWTEEQFNDADGIIYVGATGIAVRAIAPYVVSKTSDPAVVVVDEGGNFAISLLSGHLGGGNDLARQIAAVCGATSVITTATDINGVFAVDEWAKHQRCHILNPHRIKTVSGALLRGENVIIRCFVPIEGQPPEGVCQGMEAADVVVDIRVDGNRGRCENPTEPSVKEPLKLIPQIAVLGIGCRRGISCQQLEESFRQLLQETGIAETAICQAASIDLKKDEEGLLEFCRNHGFPFVTYPADELETVQGDFSASEFVRNTIGVDNVCERSAVLASKGVLCRKKIAGNGVTMALALKPYTPDWRWKDE